MKEKIETSRCSSSVGIVSYMYNEMSTVDRLAFEEHLVSCVDCTDEFAEIADARFSVYEWRKVEFEAMETPPIAIPYATAANTSWIGRLREAFSFAPAWATAGVSLAVIAVVFGAAIVTDRLNNGDEIANAVQKGNSPLVSQAESDTAVEKPSEIVSAKPLNTEDIANPETAASTDVMPVRPAAERIIEPAKTVRRLKPVPEKVRQGANVERRIQTSVPPTFTEFAEQEDESLRLAELFNDIETSD